MIQTIEMIHIQKSFVVLSKTIRTILLNFHTFPFHLLEIIWINTISDCTRKNIWILIIIVFMGKQEKLNLHFSIIHYVLRSVNIKSIKYLN